MIKCSDYIAKFLAEAGLKHVFLLSGGGAMHLNDSFGKEPSLEVVCNHHEQASAMAAESYARLSQQPAIVNVTTGPGGINTLNGVFGAYVDSIPMVVVSGQVRYDTTVPSTGLPMRQLGDQECQIVEMVRGITKYAVMVTDAKTIKYHLQKALYLATHGRPGPVWIDVPMNVQGTSINEEELISFDPAELDDVAPEISEHDIAAVIKQLTKAKRPVILAGSAIRQSGSHELFLRLIEQLNIPVVTAWNAHDVLYDSHPLHAGKPGSIGDRPGNFAVQNSDCVLVLGCRLNIRQVSYNTKSFAKNAFRIMVDIDPLELKKPTLHLDLPIHADIKDFMQALLASAEQHKLKKDNKWLAQCKKWKEKYPVVLAEYWNLKDKVNPYCFMQTLGECLPEDQIIVSGDGTACVVGFQALALKRGQRFYTNSGCASMGYDLPGAIGACVASGGKKIVCLAGDGSIQQNIQELAMLDYKKYPIKIFVLNNNGYHSIRQTQQNFFPGKQVGVGPESGLGFPSFEKLAHAYNLKYFKCSQHATMRETIEKALQSDEPVICEIVLDLEQQFAPKLSSRRLEDGTMVTSELEDMTPFLSRNELQENMLQQE